jgi:light-regulated signal transduction histidine kinase (bacteriophytochrome)
LADEFRELADSFDAMLARLEAHVVEQRRFAANASHELRTPLAITQSLLDVARNDPNRDSGELDDRLRAVNTRAIDLTEAIVHNLPEQGTVWVSTSVRPKSVMLTVENTGEKLHHSWSRHSSNRSSAARCNYRPHQRAPAD